MQYIKNFVYLVVLMMFFPASAGSYEDYFQAIKRDDSQAVQSLLGRGFDVNTRDPKGLHGLFLAVRDESVKTVAVLLAWPQVEVESRNEVDESPLMLASLRGLTAIARLLIDKGADVNKPGWAPLHYAATNGHVDIMNLLLEHHAYIDASSPNQSTPLMMAALYGTPSAVKLLLEAGADPSIKNVLGLTALDFALRDKRMESAQIIAAFIRGGQPKGKW